MADGPDPAPTAGAARLYGIIVTYRRADALDRMLDALACQSIELHRILVVDNADDESTRAVVDRGVVRGLRLEYHAAGTNLGPAGGIALGWESLASRAADDDWVVLLDDDDPPPKDSILADLLHIGCDLASTDASTGGVGIAGARLDRRAGRLRHYLIDEDLAAAPVDYLGGNQLPMYRCRALRAVSWPEANLFFGFDDLELGLRLRRGGWHLYATGLRRLGVTPPTTKTPRQPVPPWRRYYAVRNLVYLLRGEGARGAAWRATARGLVASPLLDLRRGRHRWMQRSWAGVRGARDGWRSRLGRTMEPEPKVPGP